MALDDRLLHVSLTPTTVVSESADHVTKWLGSSPLIRSAGVPGRRQEPDSESRADILNRPGFVKTVFA